MHKPLVIIINGKGGVGKDVICEIVTKHYKTRTYSSIEPIKQIATYAGWKGEKTAKARKFLSDLKDACTEYNEKPFHWMKTMLMVTTDYEKADIIFFHIREPKEIEKFRRYAISEGYKCKTLLIRSNRIKSEFGNHADDDVEQYTYDMIFDNDGPLKSLDDDFMKFFEERIKPYEQCSCEEDDTQRGLQDCH